MTTQPYRAAFLPLLTESAPSVGSTTRRSTMSTGAGNEPAFKMLDRNIASLGVKFPLISARPPRMASRITGAE